MNGKQDQKRGVVASDLQAAFDLLDEHVDLRQVDRDAPLRNNAVYTNGLALWMMVLQRLTPQGTLESSVKQLVESGSSLLPKNNKRVTEKTLSLNTAAFSNARQRLPLECVYWLHEQVSSSIIARHQSTAKGPRFFVIDGTTLSLTPTGEWDGLLSQTLIV